jgi:hypothetical protein
MDGWVGLMWWDGLDSWIGWFNGLWYELDRMDLME